MDSILRFFEGLWESREFQAVVIVVAAFVAARILDWIVRMTLTRWARRTASDLDDRVIHLLHGTTVKVVVLAGLILAAGRLNIDEDVHDTTTSVLLTIGVLVLSVFAFRLTSLLLRAATRREDRFKLVEERTFPLFDNAFKVFLAGGVVYLVIVIWDVDATGWLASAGIIGLAVAFAAQETLSNLFAGVFIIADAPYKVGDTINLDSGERGRVVHIGLRSTRILNRDDIEITIPNSVMGKVKIVNESGGPHVKARIRCQVSVAYGSDIDLVRKVLLEAVEGIPRIVENPAPRTRIRAFAESGIDIDLLGWIDNPFFRGPTLDLMFEAVYKKFAQHGIEIPYPKRDVYVRQMPPA